MPQSQLTLLAHRLRRLTEPTVSDDHLLDDFRHHQNEAAFAALVERHGSLVMGVCRRTLAHEQDAEDAFQATFLVLARNVGRIREQKSLAGWLHGVATRIAMNAKRTLAKQRHKDHHGARPEMARANDDLSWREVRALLDEEVELLPEAYRRVFVLCCLQEMSKPEAAKLLGLKEGTVSSRLARAKAQLQERLGQRGVTLSVLLATLGLGTTQVSAASLKAAAGVAVAHVTRAASGVIPARVIALADGVGSPMLATKTKIVGALVLMLGALLTPLVAQAPKKDTPASADKTEAKSAQHILGRVLDPDGKPVAGAKVYRVFSTKIEEAPVDAPRVVATADADGRVKIPLSAVPAEKRGVSVKWMAVADGFGSAHLDIDAPLDQERVFRLVKDDAPIVGRIVNLEGKPLRGVTVKPFMVQMTEKENLSDWLAAVAKSSANDTRHYFPHGVTSLTGIPGLPAKLITDADGRFRLPGVGRERLVALEIGGPMVESDFLLVMTRPGKMVRIKDSPSGEAELKLYPATFEHTAGPPQPVVGTVRDGKTNQPIAGAVIETGMDMLFPNRTAKDGTYRVDSLSAYVFRDGRAQDLLINVKPPANEPYLPVTKAVKLVRRGEPLRADFTLLKGVWAEGKVIDKATGKGVRATLDYYADTTNPHLKDYVDNPSSVRIGIGTFQTKADGTFRVPVLPGAGALFARVSPAYLAAEVTPRLKSISVPGGIVLSNFHAVAFIDAKPGEGVKATLAVDPGRAVVCSLIDGDGNPIRGAVVRGVHSFDNWNRDAARGDRVTLLAMGGKQGRWVFAIHPERQLGATVQVPADAKEPVEVKLTPTATVTGRLLEADGVPWKRQTLQVLFEAPKGTHLNQHLPGEVTTDDDGRFRVPNVLPGMTYQVCVGDKPNGRTIGVVKAKLVLKSGETKDLGDIKPRMFRD